MAEVNAINEKIIALKTHMESLSKKPTAPESKPKEKEKGEDSPVEIIMK